MTAIAKVIKRLEQLESVQNDIAIAVLKNDIPGTVAELNREMLEEGRDYNGQFITPKYRNKSYARRKQALNSKPPAGTPDLKLTGKYHRAIKEKFTGNKVNIENTDSKDKRLSAKYENIKGLGPIEMVNLRELALPNIRDRVKDFILS